MSIILRAERPEGTAQISALTQAAFRHAPHASGREAEIVDALRADGQLTVSWVVQRDAELLGHVAVSPVSLRPSQAGWLGLGPVSVWPAHQSPGIGAVRCPTAR